MLNKKYDFSFNVSALSDYTNENTGLVAKAVKGAKTIGGGIEILPGQKGDVKLNVLSHNLYLQAAACGWTTSGTTTIGQVSVDVCPIDYKEALCPKTLEPKWLGQIMTQGSDPETLPFEKYIIDDKIKNLSSQLEYLFWQGNTATGTGNLALCTGLIQSLSGKSAVYVAAATGTTAANIIASVNAMVTNIPEEIALENDLTLYMSVANYKLYTAALRLANLYHYNGEDGTNMTCSIPGTNVTAVATPGLTGLGGLYLTTKSNLVFVTDLLSETEEMKMWYSQDNDEIRIKAGLKFGVGCYFPTFVVHNNSALGV